jgi:hypothetical protein
MSEDEKLLALLQRIYDKTVQGELHWEPTANASVFVVAFARFSLSLQRVYEPAEDSDYVLLRISNDQGQTVEELSEGAAVRIGFRDMSKLYERARRIAMGLDEVLDELLTELGDSPQRKSN